MSKVQAKAYVATKMILLAFNWEDGKNRNDFIGFAIKREPGYKGKPSSFLPNRTSFEGPKKGKEFPTDKCPIQKFMWWDNRVDPKDKKQVYTYTIYPVTGPDKDHLSLNESLATKIKVKLQPDVSNGIGSYFNRAVVSSQAFSAKFKTVNDSNRIKALEWLADGLEKQIPEFISKSPAIEGAIYHLSDEVWTIPALKKYKKPCSMVYDAAKKTDTANKPALEALGGLPNFDLKPRTRISIMHNKFLVRLKSGKPTDLMMGSANYTTDGLTQQANYIHTFASSALAAIYLERKQLLYGNPEKKDINADAGWSKTVKMAGNVKIRALFSPEKKPARAAMDEIIKNIGKAKSSVCFSLFATTDKEMRDAIFAKADEGKMMFGLINTVSDEMPASTNTDASTVARVDIYHRSQNNKDVFGHAAFSGETAPNEFWFEKHRLGSSQHPVYIHHKFIIIDAETDNPIIYTGSANMSNNSQYNNDENLLEIKGSHALAQIYLAEFLRIYEHYRSRALWQRYHNKNKKKLELFEDRRWANDDYRPGSPKFKSRINMVK
jgi:hypothetical protein